MGIVGMTKVEVQTFPDRDALFDHVAAQIAKDLRAAVDSQGTAFFAASGGNTPKPVYQRLASMDDLPWKDIVVTLTDERRAPGTPEAQNAVMLQDVLLQGPAARATFLPLTALGSLDTAPERFSSVLLGMGADGHYASIFPAGEGTAAAQASGAPRLAAVTPDPLPPEAPFPRFTLTLDAIAKSDTVVLLITGNEKRSVFEHAHTDTKLPVHHLMHRQDVPLEVLWAE